MNIKDEVKNLMDAYGKMLDVWKIHNENYFKRVQIFMGVLQVGLLLAATNSLLAKPSSLPEKLIPIFLGILGLGSAFVWIGLNRTQMQYLEFCRRSLRNLESKLAAHGVPLEYFVSESLVFGPYRELHSPLCSASSEGIGQGAKRQGRIRFHWSQEPYPDDEKAGVGDHSVHKVRGGMVSREKRVVCGAVLVFGSLSFCSDSG